MFGERGACSDCKLQRIPTTIGIYSDRDFSKGAFTIHSLQRSSLSLSFVLFINSQPIPNIFILTRRLYALATQGMINRDNAKFHPRFPSIARESIVRPLISFLLSTEKLRDRKREEKRRPGTDSRIAFVRFIASVYCIKCLRLAQMAKEDLRLPSRGWRWRK